MLRAGDGVQSAPVRHTSGPECVPRSVHCLLYAVIRVVKGGLTRLAVYSRGRDALRPYAEGAVREPPTIKPCISTAKNRGTKGSSSYRIVSTQGRLTARRNDTMRSARGRRL